MDNINKKMVLLIVEDEKVLADTLGEKLVAEGFEVVKASDGEEGLQLALSKHPDLILLDLLMPKVDGLTMFKKLREDPWGVKTKVIILSNFIDPEFLTKENNPELASISEYMLKTDWSLSDIVSEIKKKLV